MTEERERAYTQLKTELVKAQAFKDLTLTTGFILFRDLIEQKREEYRTLLEVAETDKIKIAQGGLIAIREILNTFDATIARIEELSVRIKELEVE